MTPTPVALPTFRPPPTPNQPSKVPSTSVPVEYGPATLVHGTEQCETTNFPFQTPDPSGMLRYRDFKLDCVMTMDDPRVSGTKTGAIALDIWGNLRRAAVVEWFDRTITNDGGSWVGTGMGIFTNETGDLITIWFRGTGAYDGLSFMEWIEAPPGTVDVGYPVTGLIFPGDPPPPFGER